MATRPIVAQAPRAARIEAAGDHCPAGQCRARRRRGGCRLMPLNIIVSYDGTAHDDDALTLGRMLAASGATLSLAYVRHSHEYDPRREEIAEHDAARRLEQGAIWLGDESVTRHVVVNPATSAGLGALAASESADLIVFGSDYRTPPGRLEPGGSAQGRLGNGSGGI